LKKDDAAPLTMMNVLSGKFEHPKVVLSWKQNSWRAHEKSGFASAADLFAEKTEIDNLQAAINLLHEGQNRLPDEGHLESLQLVVRKMKEHPLPWHKQRALIGKAAHECTRAKKV
jgi:hypothetical protein